MNYLFSTLLSVAMAVSVPFTAAGQRVPAREAGTLPMGKVEKVTPRAVTAEGSVTFSQRKGAPSPFARVAPILNVPAMASADVASRAAASKVKLRGAMTDNSEWYSLSDADKPYGIYELSTESGNAGYKLVKADARFYVMDAIYAGDKLWISHAVEDPSTFQVKSMTYYTFDPVTWDVLGEAPGDKGLSFMTSAWSAPDEVAYCTWQGSSGFTFGTFDIEYGIQISIGKLDKRLVVMAAHSDGTLYGIDESGALVVIDKQTGKVSKTVGNTGVVSYWRTSAAIDSNSNIMYYIDCGSSKSALYAVDLETAAATKLYDFANAEQLIGLYVVEDDTPGTVPAKVADLAMNFESGALSGSISFTVPTVFYDGSAATGAVTYSLSVDGTVTATGDAAWGERCTVPVSFGESGSHEFSVTLTNATGNSPVATVSGWVGSDAPAAVTGATATWSNGKFTIKWTAPTAGVNGGYLDASALRYNVVRTPGDVLVADGIAATTCTDELEEPVNQMIGYTYTITPVCGDMTGEPVTTSKKSIGYFIPPYSNDFATSAQTAGFTVLDANKDGKKWGYNSGSQAMRIIYSSSIAMDDWVFTPAFQLEEGCSYTFSFKARAHNNSDAERIEAAVSTGTSVASVVEMIVPATDIVSKDWVTLSGSFKPSKSGRYRLGLHGISPKNSYYLYVTGIEVSAGASTSTPGAVTDLVAAPASDGSLKATISFTTPAVDVSGNAISSLEKVELSRNGELLTTFNAPGCGEPLSYEDTEAPAGNVTYSVVAYNADGAGASVQTTVFVGFAAPVAPAEVSVRPGSSPGEAVIIWSAPATDINGKPLDAANVTYDILRRAGDTTETIKTGVTACTYTDRAVADDAEQDFYSYGVAARTTGGTSEAVATALIPLGKPYEVPFRESFANGRIGYVWGLDSSTPTAGWLLGQDTSIDGIKSEDNDNGLLIMEAMSKGANATIYSGSIAVPAEGAPTLCFAYYNHNSLNTLEVAVAETGSATGKRLTTVTLDPSAPEGWVNVPLDLSAYKGKNVQIYFTATVVNTTIFVMDNVRIECRQDHDLAVRGVSMPSRVAVGSAYEINVALENRGLNAASGYTVSLVLDGQTVEVKDGPALAPGQASTVAFSRTMLPTDAESAVYEAEIKYASDADLSNNKSGSYTVLRVVPEFPVPESPAYEVSDAGITLSWSAPDLTVEAMQPIVDDAEDYTAFSTGLAGSAVFDDYVGDWLMVDNDGVVPYALTSAGKLVEFPNSGRPVGFMVFDASLLNLVEWNAYSGKQMFVSFASGYAPNDDWMISPRLSGSEQTVTFRARSLTTMYGAESFQFYYSTTDTRLSSFTRIATVNEVPAEWTEYTYTLPEGARYFAIRCISDQTFAFLVDDVTYTPAHPADGLSLTGYNVYRNGVLITEKPVTDPVYVDTAATEAENTYHVTAVYDRGESALSAPVTVKTSGIGSILNDGELLHDVYGIDGITIKRGASIEEIGKLPKGVYIIGGRKVAL